MAVEGSSTGRALEIIIASRERGTEVDYLATKFRLHVVNNLLYVHSAKSIFQEQMLVQLRIPSNTGCLESAVSMFKQT
jgi:hypothetical protein